MEQLAGLAEQLSSIINSLKDLAKTARQTISDAQAAKVQFDKRTAALAEKDLILLDREKAVALEEKKWSGFGALDAAQNKLECDKSDFDNARRVFERDRSARQAALDEGEAGLKIARTAMVEDRKALDNEKATYKQNLLIEAVNELKKGLK